MSVPVLSPVSLTSFYDPYDGSVLQASLYFYRAQSLDGISVYTDATLGIPHAQPVLSSGSGRVPPVWIGDVGYYRVRAFDQYGTLLEDIDGLPGATVTVEDGGSGGTPGDLPPADSNLDVNLDWTTLQPGDIFASFSKGGTKRPGAVRCNGGTIGRGAGGDPAPSEHAGLECYNLYVWLWGQDAEDPYNLLYIPGPEGKGTTSGGDWEAGRLLTLPDLRGRTIVGTDPMGNGAPTGRMTGAVFDKVAPAIGSDASVPGAGGGTATKTLNIEQMPVHTHAITDPKHQHAGITSTESNYHTHVIDGNTEANGVHQHSLVNAASALVTGGSQQRFGGNQQSGHDYSSQPAGSHVHHMAFASGVQSQLHSHTYATDLIATGITITHAGGKGTAPTLPANFVTQPVSLAQPFLTLTWFMSLGPKYPEPVISP